MNDTPTDSSAAHQDRSLEHRVRTRYEHACGQLIWVIEAPQGSLYFAELLPTLPVWFSALVTPQFRMLVTLPRNDL